MVAHRAIAKDASRSHIVRVPPPFSQAFPTEPDGKDAGSSATARTAKAYERPRYFFEPGQ